MHYQIMIIKEIKLVIDSNIPEDRKQLVWIINNLGKHLYNQKIWDKHNLYKNEEQQHPNSIDGIIQIINQFVTNKEEKEELIKYLFGKSLNKLSNI